MPTRLAFDIVPVLDMAASHTTHGAHGFPSDVLEPLPAQIRVGMAVEFRPSVNPPGSRYANKPIALELQFVGSSGPPPP